MNRRVLFAVAALAASSPTAFAQQAVPSPVQAHDAWARATPSGASTAAVYITLVSPAGDVLTGASSPVAQKSAVHETRMEGNIMRMREVPGGLELPAGKPVVLAPGGYHLMLEQLKAPLKVGQTVPVRLTFRNAPPLDVVAQIRPIGASAMPGAGPSGAMPGMKMGH